jgi:hypothetical protein
MKATDEEYDFHQRILARDDPIAFAAFAELFYDSLLEDVRRRAGSGADPVLVEESVGEALLDYHDSPERYDPKRASLQSYLSMATYRDFQNASAKERRVTGHQVSLFDPAFQEQDIVESQETIDSQLQEEKLWQLIDQVFPVGTSRPCPASTKRDGAGYYSARVQYAAGIFNRVAYHSLWSIWSNRNFLRALSPRSTW